MKVIEIGDGKYIWMRNREQKQRGGMMLLVRKQLTVESTTMCGEGEAEVLEVKLKRNLGRYLSIIVNFLPPKANSSCGGRI